MKLFVDGGSRHNPGPSAWAVITNPYTGDGFGGFVEHATNNHMEWEALIQALDWVVKNKIEDDAIQIYSDSKLVVEQFNGRWKVKRVWMRDLCRRAQEIADHSELPIEVRYTPRLYNKQADKLVNKVLDEHTKNHD